MQELGATRIRDRAMARLLRAASNEIERRSRRGDEDFRVGIRMDGGS
jgi:hypothetical protein